MRRPLHQDADAAGIRVPADQRALLEAIVNALSPAIDAPLHAAFLCRLLGAAVAAEASAGTRRDVELRVAAVLDQATAGDLLGVAGDHVANADTVRCVITAFVERHQQQEQEGGPARRPSQGELGANKLEKVARTVDEVAAEMAAEASLPNSKFVSVAGAVPRDARPSHDDMYRAVDVYLKAHPELAEQRRGPHSATLGGSSLPLPRQVWRKKGLSSSVTEGLPVAAAGDFS